MGTRIKESPESTFEVYVEVIWPGTLGSDPEVLHRFPEGFSDQETLRAVSRFCFPFSADSLTMGLLGQNFTFVLTDSESKQRFGFCRLSSGAKRCFCFLSYLPWFEVFYKLLNVLSDYTNKGQSGQQRELLETLYTLPIPDPGVPVHLSVHSHFIVPDTRELPCIPENRSLKEYFVAVDVSNILRLYASLLFERRILICCTKLSTLTSCIHGSVALLYPMFWQHVFIPVLPQYLLDYCCAPMPYLIGVHSSLMERVRGMSLEDVVILNVDTNTLETPYDDLQSLPNDTVSSLKSRLKKVSMATGDGVARAFLKAQAALFGSYRNALRIEPGEPITFSKEVFVTHRSSTMRHFLENAIQLQLFKQFIDGRLDLLNSGEGFSDVFEEEINAGEYAGSDRSYHQWLSTVKKGSGAIFNTVKTKANPAMKTVYKFAKDHARMGIKEVKSRLKQKDLQENGHSPATKDSQQQDWKDVQLCNGQQPITEHFGQPGHVVVSQLACPPQPVAVKKPLTNVVQDSNSSEGPQPSRSLKEMGLAKEEEPQEDKGAEFIQSCSSSHSLVPERVTQVDLLGDLFWSLEGEPESPSISLLPKSLVDIQPVGGSEKRLANFRYQVSGGEVGQESFRQILKTPPLLPLPVANTDIAKSTTIGNGGADLLCLLDPLKSAPGPQTPPSRPTPSLCLYPLTPSTCSPISLVPCTPQILPHPARGPPHRFYTPPSGHIHYIGRGLSQQTPALPGLIWTPLVLSNPPQGGTVAGGRSQAEAPDPFMDVTSQQVAPPETQWWETFN